ncbi:hypothetical protein G3570_07930 [Balneolaceae bacterium YR4-1]|uniref:Uncharacterized protein n=1 Tax=Halalkalibaculum roseum TaxID=2709311 RepID=A0A6M1T1E2_9BACT|nr:hypothetical protein [Halalkalibaculum roseum]NGP76557.1 hypothetical protein [Halalkalibaculum roseum]
MKHAFAVTQLSILIAVLAALASYTGIYSEGGPGPHSIESVRGETVIIYGKGLYRHMSKEVAPQGIAQDYVTLYLAIPLLFIALIWARKGSLKGRYFLSGILGYFLVTYLFYLVMGMYNALFLVYVALLSMSFFAFALTMLSFEPRELPERFSEETPVKSTGGFLIFQCIAISLMWLGVVIPPLISGEIIPPQVEHYTTLIVQGLDLALLLPLGIIAGVLFINKNPFGYLLTPVYYVFLSLLMIALTAKIIIMGSEGQNTMPAILIIPSFGIIAMICTLYIFNSIREVKTTG